MGTRQDINENFIKITITESQKERTENNILPDCDETLNGGADCGKPHANPDDLRSFNCSHSGLRIGGGVYGASWILVATLAGCLALSVDPIRKLLTLSGITSGSGFGFRFVFRKLSLIE